MEDILCKTEYNDLFEKFMTSIKDELYLKFNEFVKNSSLKLERSESVEIDNITPVKKTRGRPKKNVDDIQDDSNKTKKRGRGRPKKNSIESLQVTVVNDTDDESEKKRGRPNNEEKEVIRDVFVDDSNESDDDGIDVVRIEIDGNIYLRDASNKLYNMSDQEYVGVYDEVNGVIVSS